MENEFTTKQFNGEVPKDTEDVASMGKGLKMISSKKILFNHDLANKYLIMENYPFERHLKDNHVIFIAQQMKKGMFRPEITKLASCFCVETDKEYRINGQHTTWARLEVSEEEYEPETVECLKYEAQTLNDVRILYATFDRGSPRTKANVIGSYLTGTDQFGDASPTLIRSLAEGFSFWRWEMSHERAKHYGDDVAFLLQTEYKDLTDKVLAFCEEQPKLLSVSFMRRAAVVAAMFETFSVVYKASEEFWYAIKVGAELSADDPRLRLRTVLMTCNTSKSHVVTNEKKVLSAETLYRNCISSFNYWRSGETIKSLRVTAKRQRAK